jgi:hypothetical protein
MLAKVIGKETPRYGMWTTRVEGQGIISILQHPNAESRSSLRSPTVVALKRLLNSACEDGSVNWQLSERQLLGTCVPQSANL